MAKKQPANDFVWIVVMTKDDGIKLEFGPELSDAPMSDDAKIHALGKSLIGLGTRLMGSSAREDDDLDDDWDA